MRAILKLCMIIFAFISCAAFAQDAKNIATLRAKEAESLARLTAEGRALYNADANKQRWGDYCASSRRLSEDGELREAVRMASRALFLGEQARDQQALAYAKRDLSLAYSYAGDLARAEEYASQSKKHTDASSGRWPKGEIYGVVHKVLGDVNLRRGRPEDAIREYQKALEHSSDNWKFFVQVSLANAFNAAGKAKEARNLFAGIGMPSDSGRRHLVLRGLGNLALADGKNEEAVKLFKEVLSTASNDDAAYQRVWALEGIGRAHAAAGNKEAALKAYLDAVETAQQLRIRFRNEEFKSGLFGEMRRIFDEAIRLLVDQGQTDKAWEISEKGRGRALLDMVRNRVTIGSGASAFVDPLGSTVTAAEMRAGLPDGMALVQYHVVVDRTYAWIMRTSGVQLVIIDTKRETLAHAIERFRDAVLERRPAANELGANLYRMLVQPLGLKAGEGLIVIAHDVLHYLPFQALRDGESFLIEKHVLSYAPSASTLKTLLVRPLMSRRGNVVGLGNPDLGDPKMALPGAQREVEHLKSVFPSASVFVRENATKRRLLEQVKGTRLMHIAAHAEVDEIDPLYSKIRLAPSGEDRGELEAHEVYRLDLSHSWMVVLSACDSGLGRISSGDEIWGFTRAFLGAGTNSLMVTLWPVADESTERVMARFYEEVAKGTDRRESLRKAQLALLKDSKFGSPFFWAPFNLVGDWR